LKKTTATAFVAVGVVAIIFLLAAYPFYYFGLYTGVPPAINVALSSNPVCSVSTGNCVFVLENLGEQCDIMNITLYLHGDTTVAQTISDIPWGVVNAQTFDSTLLRHHNQTEIVSFPNTLQQGTVIYYQIYINNIGETIFGPITVS
jgi:hypothetical protein